MVSSVDATLVAWDTETKEGAGGAAGVLAGVGRHDESGGGGGRKHRCVAEGTALARGTKPVCGRGSVPRYTYGGLLKRLRHSQKLFPGVRGEFFPRLLPFFMEACKCHARLPLVT